MHILYPCGIFPVRVFLFYVEILCDLPPDTHEVNVCFKGIDL